MDDMQWINLVFSRMDGVACAPGVWTWIGGPLSGSFDNMMQARQIPDSRHAIQSFLFFI